MRVWVMALALAAWPAAAQELGPADGRAEVAGKVGDVIVSGAAGGFDTRAEMRPLMAAILEDVKISADEKDLLREMVGPTGVAVTVQGKTVTIAALPADIAWMPQSLLTRPNLHQLWHRGGPAAEQFVEMAQWGPAMHQRIYRYIGHQMDDAWKTSNVLNGYSPYVTALAGQYRALETLPADVETRTYAFDLLTTGIAYGVDKANAEGRAPPQEFLYRWLLADDVKPRFVNAQPKQLPPQVQSEAGQQFQ